MLLDSGSPFPRIDASPERDNRENMKGVNAFEVTVCGGANTMLAKLYQHRALVDG